MKIITRKQEYTFKIKAQSAEEADRILEKFYEKENAIAYRPGSPIWFERSNYLPIKVP